MKRLEDLLLQQATARETRAPTPPAPVEVVAPRGSSPALDTSRTAPIAAPQEEAIAAPPAQSRIFDGEKVDHWIVEKWLMHMEKLFRDTFVEERDRVVDRALIVESGAADVQERREALDKGKAKRPAAEGASQTHSRRPSKHPRSQQRGRGSASQQGGTDRRRPPQCVICGGPHFLLQCPKRAAPALPAASHGIPSAQYQPGRPSVQRQSKRSRQVPSGRMYAAQTEEEVAAEDVVAGDWIMPVDLLALRKLGKFDVVLGMD
uniref:Uncharacterized protein n=1 Tax=Ananas comosus var. bracteatus TaxID=296719 RepID=A0A6V7P4J7_ANACO|nr:unnamed protein product [Ananas comosus var. bracteatus]